MGQFTVKLVKVHTIASSIGKVFKKNVNQDVGNFRVKKFQNLLFMVRTSDYDEIRYLMPSAVDYSFVMKDILVQLSNIQNNVRNLQMITENFINAYGIPKLENLGEYNPLQLANSTTQRNWIDVLEKNLHSLVKFVKMANIQRRASSFDILFREH